MRLRHASAQVERPSTTAEIPSFADDQGRTGGRSPEGAARLQAACSRRELMRAPCRLNYLLAESVLVAPEGELDIARAGEFRAQLSDAAGEAATLVVVDLSSVSFIDSSALGAVVELYNRLRRETRQLAVVAPAGTAVIVMLTLAGLRDRLPIFELRQAALEMSRAREDPPAQG